jgi:hypothetical protein
MRGLLFIAAAGLLFACSDDEVVPVQTTGSAGAPAGGAGGDGGTAGLGGVGGNAGEGGTAGMGGSCESTLPNEETPPAMLSQTGLYSDIASKTLAPYVQEFTPQFPLWSDSAVKTRWIYLPECEPQIDNSEEDDWDFPVGTRVWKQFERDGLLIETRMIHRWGPGANDYALVAYRWDDLDTDATLLTTGEIDAKGTEHDIPTGQECTRCHGAGIGPGGWPGRILGFSAIQLSHAGSDVTMATLSNEGRLLVPNATGYTVPGNPTEQAALGYIHANCSSCHNPSSEGLVFPYVPMRLSTLDLQVDMTAVYVNLVDQDPVNFLGHPCTKLVDGTAATPAERIANSCVHYRMGQRGPDTAPGPLQMPPLGTGESDASGIAAIEAWISGL